MTRLTIQYFLKNRYTCVSDVVAANDNLLFAEALQKNQVSPFQIINNFCEIARINRLAIERSDRFTWFLNGVDDIRGSDIIRRHLILNSINPWQFAHDVRSWLQCSDLKRNTLFLWGPPNTGKTTLTGLLTAPFLTSYLTMQASTSEFYYDAMLNHTLIHMEEAFFVPGVIETMKSVLGGFPITVARKHISTRQPLQRTPCAITSNHRSLSRQYCAITDDEACLRRCYTYHLSRALECDYQLTPASMRTFIKAELGL